MVFDLNIRAFKVEKDHEPQGHWFAAFCRFLCAKHLHDSGIESGTLLAALTPKYKYGCNRACFSESYYDVFKKDNVRLHTSGVSRVEGRTVTTPDGARSQLDALVLCTGYKAQDFFAPMRVVGSGGVDVLALWRKDVPRTFYGIVSDVMPNAFMLLGPNTLLGHNSVVFMAECQVAFVVKVIAEMLRTKTRVCRIRGETQDRWMAGMKAEMKGTVWGTEDCGSWYTNERNEVTTLWPESCTSYWLQTRRPNFKDFSFE